MRRIAFAAVVLLAACSRQAEQPKTPDAASPAPPAAPAPVFVWSADGPALVLREKGAEIVRLECGKDGLTVHGERFQHVGSEERMSIGAGDVVVALVATADDSVSPPAVKGEGPADSDFLSAFSEGRKFAINYGYQNMGPYDGPPRELAEPFAAACTQR